jgi:hypothetical protein
MERRTLLRNLVSSVVAVPLLSAFGSANTLVEADDENYMRRAIRLAGGLESFGR